MFDITQIATLNTAERWLTNFHQGLEQKEKEIPLLIVGGKSDLKESREVDKEDIMKIRKQFGFFDYLECSSKTGANVHQIFEKIVLKIMKVHGYIK
jgi:Ras-related protein Rab-18